MEFLDFDQQRIGKLNYRETHNICLSQQHQTHIRSIIQIWYKTTSGLKPKSMKTSDTMAWECKLFTQEFPGFIDV